VWGRGIPDEDDGARILEGNERQPGAGDGLGKRDGGEQRRAGNARAVRDLKNEEHQRRDHQHRGRYPGLRRCAGHAPPLDRNASVQALAKIR